MTHDQLAADLLTPLWKGISADYKHRYAHSVWQQFEDNLRSAAYTSRLTIFLDKITLRLGVGIGKEETGRVSAIIQCGEDKAVLKMLREELAPLVLLVRLANEERKTKYQKKETPADENLPLRGASESDFFN